MAGIGVRAGTGARPYAASHMALLVSLLGRAQDPPLRCLPCGMAGSAVRAGTRPAPTLSSMWPCWYPLRCPPCGLVGFPYAVSPCGLVGFAVGAGLVPALTSLKDILYGFCDSQPSCVQCPSGAHAWVRIIACHQGGDPRGHTNTECASSAMCATSLSVLCAFARDSYPHVRPLAFPFKSEKKKENCHGPSSLGVLFCP